MFDMMSRRAAANCLALFAFTLAISGCSSQMLELLSQDSRYEPVEDSVLYGPSTKALNVPLYTYQGNEGCCGAFSLSMVISYWEKERNAMDDFASPRRPIDIDLPCAKEGISSATIKSAARELGYETYIYSGSPYDISRNLALTRPLIVLLRRNKSNHFVVVIGRDDKQRIIVNDPALGRIFMDKETLLKEWSKNRFLSLLIVPIKEAEAQPPGPASALD